MVSVSARPTVNKVTVNFSSCLAGRFPHPVKASKNMATRKENIIFMGQPSLCRRAVLLPQVQKHMSVCPESGVHEETDSTFFCKSAYFMTQMNNFLV